MLPKKLIKKYDELVTNEKYNTLLHETLNQITKDGTFIIGTGDDLFIIKNEEETKILELSLKEQNKVNSLNLKIDIDEDNLKLIQDIKINFYKNIIHIENKKIENNQEISQIEQYLNNELKIYCLTEENQKEETLSHKVMCILDDKTVATYESDYIGLEKKEKFKKSKEIKPFVFNDMENKEECKIEYNDDIPKRTYKKLERKSIKELKRVLK
jgi:hypothetical protein